MPRVLDHWAEPTPKATSPPSKPLPPVDEPVLPVEPVEPEPVEPVPVLLLDVLELDDEPVLPVLDEDELELELELELDDELVVPDDELDEVVEPLDDEDDAEDEEDEEVEDEEDVPVEPVEPLPVEPEVLPDDEDALEPEDDVEACRARIEDCVRRCDTGDGVVLLTDMFGGTPSNLAISMMERKGVEVIAGVNLPMLVKLASVRADVELKKAVDLGKEAGRKYISVASQVLAGET